VKRATALLALAAALAGCADLGPIRGRLHYGMDDAPEGQKLMWPAAPEVPRFIYTGTLVGEPNFRDDEQNGRSPLNRFGRWLVGLDASERGPLVLQRPAALAGDDQGRLYVSDASKQAVFVFDAKAGELHLWEQAERTSKFVSPAGLAASADRVYVADAELRAVFALDARGEPQSVIGRGQLARPTGLVRDGATARLFVADTYAHTIKVFDEKSGALVATLGQRGDGPGQFNYPSYLALANGELYVTDTMNSRIQVLRASDGAFQREFGARGLYLGNLVRPKGVAVDGEGNVYVIESLYDSLLVFSRNGEFLMPIGGTGKSTGRFYLPAGVWVDANNRVHIADMFNGRVVSFQFLGGG
jgi:DNA-binding beta-propeller fold protein YncE